MKSQFHDLDPAHAKKILGLDSKELERMSKGQLIKSFNLLRMILFLEIRKQAEEIEKYQQELENQKQKKINQEANCPSSKKGEWEKGEKVKGKKRKRKKKRKRQPGCGNQNKEQIKPDIVHRNPLERCPQCQLDMRNHRVVDEYSRIIEDMIELENKTEVREEIQERKWCPGCRAIVSSVSERALPKSDMGIKTMVLAAYMWVVLVLSLPNIRKFLNQFKKIKVSTAGISKMMIRLSGILQPVYDEILQDVKKGASVWADETGWKIKGVLWWLWIFANQRSAYYWPDRSRGSPVVEKILGKFFLGVLISDAWCAYTKIVCEKQTCMAHIFRKIKGFIKEYSQYRSILKFFVKLRKIIKDGEKLQKSRSEIGEKIFQRKSKGLLKRIKDVLAWKNPNPILAKVIKKVRRQEKYILTFVNHENVPSHNNYGEYIIRKGVLKRKVSGGSMSDEGAKAYACIQSIAQTCHLRDIPFHHFLQKTLVRYIKTGKPLLLEEYEAQMKQVEESAA